MITLSLQESIDYVRTVEYKALLANGYKTPIKGPAATQIKPIYAPIIHNYSFGNYYSSPFFVFGNFYPAIPLQSGKSNDDTGRVLLAILGLVISFIAGFCFGYAYKKCDRAAETLQQTHKIKNFVSTHQLASVERTNPIYTDFTNLIKAEEAINQRHYNKVVKNTCAAAGFLAGGITLTLGAVFGSPLVLMAAGVVLLASTILIAVSLGIHLDDDKLLRDHYVTILGGTNSQGQPVESLSQKVLKKLGELKNPPPPYSNQLPPPFNPDYEPICPEFSFSPLP